MKYGHASIWVNQSELISGKTSKYGEGSFSVDLN